MLDRLAVLGFALLQDAGLNGLFAVGTQLGVGAGRGVLGLADLGGDGQTALEQFKDLVVQAVDLGAQGGQRLLLGAQFGLVSGPDLLDIGLRHGIGLSAWISMGRSRPPRHQAGTRAEAAWEKRSPARLSGLVRSPTPQPAYRKP
ncbi:hypothetical protein D3C80_1210710 [compost metagenome]